MISRLGATPEQIARGRELTLAGVLDPPGMSDCLALMAYRRDQARIVSQRGSCSGHCHCTFIRTRSGEHVCPHSWQACPRHKLSLIVERWEGVCSGS
jgi:hypothetical protein